MDRTISQQVHDLLRHGEHAGLLDLCETDKRFWDALRFCLFETDEDLRWSAIEVTAQLMERWWSAGRRENVRDHIRRLLWSLNHESGGIGWSAPQVIAEIIIRIPQLLTPYGSMMISQALEEPVLVKSGLWGMGRLGTLIATCIYLVQEAIFDALESEDIETQGIAAWAVGEVGFTPTLPYLEKLLEREEPVQIYFDGCFHSKSLGRWATETILKINA